MPYTELGDSSKELDNGPAPLCPGSLSHIAALLSCRGAINTCKHVVGGNVKKAFVVIRPPGQHAEYDQPLGVCFFNDVPIAVRVCRQDYADVCRKVRSSTETFTTETASTPVSTKTPPFSTPRPRGQRGFRRSKTMGCPLPGQLWWPKATALLADPRLSTLCQPSVAGSR